MLFNLLVLVSGWIDGVILKSDMAVLLTKPQHLRSLLLFLSFFFGSNFSSLMDV